MPKHLYHVGETNWCTRYYVSSVLKHDIKFLALQYVLVLSHPHERGNVPRNTGGHIAINWAIKDLPSHSACNTVLRHLSSWPHCTKGWASRHKSTMYKLPRLHDLHPLVLLPLISVIKIMWNINQSSLWLSLHFWRTEMSISHFLVWQFWILPNIGG